MICAAGNSVVICLSASHYSRNLAKLLTESVRKASVGKDEAEVKVDRATIKKKVLIKKVLLFARLVEVLMVIFVPAFLATAFWPWMRNIFLYITPWGQVATMLICAASCFLIKY